jgi:hypothetical protein
LDRTSLSDIVPGSHSSSSQLQTALKCVGGFTALDVVTASFRRTDDMIGNISVARYFPGLSSDFANFPPVSKDPTWLVDSQATVHESPISSSLVYGLDSLLSHRLLARTRLRRCTHRHRQLELRVLLRNTSHRLYSI